MLNPRLQLGKKALAKPGSSEMHNWTYLPRTEKCCPGTGTDPELEAPATFWGRSGNGEANLYYKPELKLAFDAG